MVDLYLNNNHELELDGGDLRVTTDDEIVRQRLIIRLQFLLGEWFLDTTQGLPYVQTIYEAGKSDFDTLYSIFRSEVQKVEGVESIESLELDLDGEGRDLTVTVKVNQTITAEVTL